MGRVKENWFITKNSKDIHHIDDGYFYEIFKKDNAKVHKCVKIVSKTKGGRS